MTQQKIGRYEIIKEIGSGGFATVFQARDTTLERDVAMKVMRPLLMSDSGFVARFQREAQVAANLEHPHIIPIHDFGEHNGRLYLVMKLVRQGSLETRIKQGAIPFDQVVSIANQIANALDYAHKKQIIHRDIKPDNILLGQNDHIYLTDFGLVKALEQSSLTASLSGGVLGTPAYVAPEIWHGREASPGTDIYALACLLFEMVSGRALFSAATPPATMLLHFKEPDFPSQWASDVPSGFSEILRRALAQDPEERYATSTEFVQSLVDLTKIDPLADDYETLRNSLQQQEWDEAINQAEAIMAQNIQYRDVQALLTQALDGKSQTQQAIWIAHWREQSHDAVGQANWALAKSALARWQELEPDNSDIHGLLKKVGRQESSGLTNRNVRTRRTQRALPNAHSAAHTNPTNSKRTKKVHLAAMPEINNKPELAVSVSEPVNVEQLTPKSSTKMPEQKEVTEFSKNLEFAEKVEQALKEHEWQTAIDIAREWAQSEPDNPKPREMISLAHGKRFAGHNSRN